MRTRFAPPVAALAAALVAAAVAGLALGGTGVVSALLAGLVVVGFFGSGALPMAAEQVAGPALGFLVLMTNYALRLLLALVVLASAARAGVVDRAAVGLTVVVCTLVWTTVRVVALSRDPA